MVDRPAPTTLGTEAVKLSTDEAERPTPRVKVCDPAGTDTDRALHALREQFSGKKFGASPKGMSCDEPFCD